MNSLKHHNRRERFTDGEREKLREFYHTLPDKRYVERLAQANKNVLMALQRWVMEGHPPGGFTQEAIKNDFVQTTLKADDYMKKVLPELATYLQVLCPVGSRGSEEVVKEWNEQGGLIGSCDEDVDKAIKAAQV